jgi:hypothetical protein
VKTNSANYVALDLPLSSRLMLRWSMDSGIDAFLTSFPHSIVQPDLHLGEVGKRKKIKTEDGNSFIAFPYSLLCDGVREAYNLCYSTREIMTAVSAKCVLVRYVVDWMKTAVVGI